jgi:hypothetical protein
MSARPWMTSLDLIESVKRKIAVPINQRTFSEEDILAFANEEMLISQVPDILMYHEEYFVFSQDNILTANVQKYSLPERAMGMKLRDVFYVDTNDNLFEMTRINPDDKAYWQRESAVINLMQKYYLEGNDVVLAPQNVSSPTGKLRFSYFLRPNQLVLNDRASICQSFFKSITITNSSIIAGDKLTVGDVVLTAVLGSPSSLEFQIGASSSDTAANLASALNLDATYSATSSTNSVVIYFSKLSTSVSSSNTAGMSVSSRIGVKFTSSLPTHITHDSKVDFLQTKAGHKTFAISVPLKSDAVSADSILFDGINTDKYTIINDTRSLIPADFQVGDYVCEEYECIIPQIPSDLHNGLAERTAARLLAAQGDAMGLQMSAAKIADIKHSEGALLDDRVDGSTQKINQRKSPLSFLRMGIRRRI